MNKKITAGVVGLAVVAGIVGVAAGTTYAHGVGRNKGGNDAAASAAFTAQRDAMTAQHDAMQQAINAGDYTAWKAAADKLANGRGKAISSIITEANFAKFVEMNKLMQQADAIRKEIGLDQGYDMGPGMHAGIMRGERGFGHRSATSTAVTNQ